MAIDTSALFSTVAPNALFSTAKSTNPFATQSTSTANAGVFTAKTPAAAGAATDSVSVSPLAQALTGAAAELFDKLGDKAKNMLNDFVKAGLVSADEVVSGLRGIAKDAVASRYGETRELGAEEQELSKRYQAASAYNRAVSKMDSGRGHSELSAQRDQAMKSVEDAIAAGNIPDEYLEKARKEVPPSHLPTSDGDAQVQDGIVDDFIKRSDGYEARAESREVDYSKEYEAYEDSVRSYAASMWKADVAGQYDDKRKELWQNNANELSEFTKNFADEHEYYDPDFDMNYAIQYSGKQTGTNLKHSDLFANESDSDVFSKADSEARARLIDLGFDYDLFRGAARAYAAEVDLSGVQHRDIDFDYQPKSESADETPSPAPPKPVVASSPAVQASSGYLIGPDGRPTTYDGSAVAAFAASAPTLDLTFPAPWRANTASTTAGTEDEEGALDRLRELLKSGASEPDPTRTDTVV